jgi:ribosomal protein S18 acetylase RimI-like enzyme
MYLVKAVKEDLQSIMRLVHDAQAYLASKQIDQWQDGYPDKGRILNDILNGESYIVKNEENQAIGTTMFTTHPESTYERIEGGWLTDKKNRYGVIHRMAVAASARKQGVAKFIFKNCEEALKEMRVDSMRIDTHEENETMQGLLKNLGYTYCGVIYLESGGKRLAYEKLLS